MTFSDLGFQAAAPAGSVAGAFAAPNDDEFCGKGPEALDLLQPSNGLVWIHGPQCCAVEQALEGGLGERSQILGFTSRQVPVEIAEHLSRREGAMVAVATDQVFAQPCGLDDSAHMPDAAYTTAGIPESAIS